MSQSKSSRRLTSQNLFLVIGALFMLSTLAACTTTSSSTSVEDRIRHEKAEARAANQEPLIVRRINSI